MNVVKERSKAHLASVSPTFTQTECEESNLGADSDC